MSHLIKRRDSPFMKIWCNEIVTLVFFSLLHQSTEVNIHLLFAHLWLLYCKTNVIKKISVHSLIFNIFSNMFHSNLVSLNPNYKQERTDRTVGCWSIVPIFVEGRSLSRGSIANVCPAVDAVGKQPASCHWVTRLTWFWSSIKFRSS